VNDLCVFYYKYMGLIYKMYVNLVGETTPNEDHGEELSQPTV